MADVVDRKTFIDFAALAIITTQSAGIDAAEAYEEAGKVWAARQAYFNGPPPADALDMVAGDTINALRRIKVITGASHASSMRRDLDAIDAIVSEVMP